MFATGIEPVTCDLLVAALPLSYENIKTVVGLVEPIVEIADCDRVAPTTYCIDKKRFIYYAIFHVIQNGSQPACTLLLFVNC